MCFVYNLAYLTKLVSSLFTLYCSLSCVISQELNFYVLSLKKSRQKFLSDFITFDINTLIFDVRNLWRGIAQLNGVRRPDAAERSGYRKPNICNLSRIRIFLTLSIVVMDIIFVGKSLSEAFSFISYLNELMYCII